MTPTKLVVGGPPTRSPNDIKLPFISQASGLLTHEFASGQTTKIAKSGWMADWRRF